MYGNIVVNLVLKLMLFLVRGSQRLIGYAMLGAMPARKETQGDTHIYRPSLGHNPTYVRFGCVAMVGMALGSALVAYISYADIGRVPLMRVVVGALVVGAIFFVMSLTTRGIADHTKLVVSPAGIEYHRPGLVLASEWSNVRSIDRTFPFPPVLMLHRSSVRQYTSFARQGWNMGRRIPLDMFDYDPQSDLAHDLRRYAPQVFADTSPVSRGHG